MKNEKQIERLGMLVHPEKPEAARLARRLAEICREKGLALVPVDSRNASLRLWMWTWSPCSAATGRFCAPCV